MASSEKTKKSAAKARGWLERFFPRKGKTPVNQGILGDTVKKMRRRRKKMDEVMGQLED